MAECACAVVAVVGVACKAAVPSNGIARNEKLVTCGPETKSKG